MPLQVNAARDHAELVTRKPQIAAALAAATRITVGEALKDPDHLRMALRGRRET